MESIRQGYWCWWSTNAGSTWIVLFKSVFEQRKSESLCSSKSTESVFDMNYDDPMLTENTESIPSDLSNQDTENSLENKEVSEVAFDFWNIEKIKRYVKINIKQYVKYEIVDCNDIMHAQIISWTDKDTELVRHK